MLRILADQSVQHDQELVGCIATRCTFKLGEKLLHGLHPLGMLLVLHRARREYAD
jgi:hypothetical protein